MLGISRPTLYRRLEEYRIDKSCFVNINSDKLDRIVKHVKSEHPNDGEVMLQGHLVRLGVKVPRKEVRCSIHRVDHVNTVARRSVVIKRRTYSVPNPNAVWHIDGNHKMIRWRLLVHAGVDGFSRTVTFANCANNNAAPTVLQAFMKGVSEFGVPEKVRSDHGGENVDVWKHNYA